MDSDRVQKRIERCIEHILVRREHDSELRRSIDAVCFPFVLVHAFTFPEKLAQSIMWEFRKELQVDGFRTNNPSE